MASSSAALFAPAAGAFFSFGTNDLTQTGLGISRDYYGGFINDYKEKDIIPSDPFQTIDFTSVSNVIEGRSSKWSATQLK